MSESATPPLPPITRIRVIGEPENPTGSVWIVVWYGEGQQQQLTIHITRDDPRHSDHAKEAMFPEAEWGKSSFVPIESNGKPRNLFDFLTALRHIRKDVQELQGIKNWFRRNRIPKPYSQNEPGKWLLSVFNVKDKVGLGLFIERKTATKGNKSFNQPEEKLLELQVEIHKFKGASSVRLEDNEVKNLVGPFLSRPSQPPEQEQPATGISQGVQLSPDDEVRGSDGLDYENGEMTQPEPSPSPTGSPQSQLQPIQMKELGLFLKAYRESCTAITDDDIVTSAHKKRTTEKREGQHIPKLITDFESGMDSSEYSLVELDDLISIYDDPNNRSDMPWLMVEWMASKKVAGPCITGQLEIADERHPNGFIDIWKGASFEREGILCDYQIPHERIEGFECALIRFELQRSPLHEFQLEDLDGRTVQELPRPYPLGVSDSETAVRNRLVASGLSEEQTSTLLASVRPAEERWLLDLVPHSKSHVHPGDEILFVKTGRVVAELCNNGGRFRLREHDIFHFAADAPHVVWNESDKNAEVLVIRFWQLRQGTRPQQTRAITKALETFKSLEKAMYLREDGKDEIPKRQKKRQKRDDTQQPPKDLLELSKSVHTEVNRVHTQVNKIMEVLVASYPFTRTLEQWLMDRSRPPMNPLAVSSSQIRDIVDFVAFSQFMQMYIADIWKGDLQVEHQSLCNLLKQLRTAWLMARDSQQTPLEFPFDQLDECLLHLADEIVTQATQEWNNLRSKHPGVWKEYPLLNMKEETNCIVLAKMLGGRFFEPESHDGASKKLWVTTECLLPVISNFFHFPQILIDHVLAPPVQRYVHIAEHRIDDWVPRPDSSGDARGASYEIPSRVLANSDISICRLTLKQDQDRSPMNQHCGYELVLVLPGNGGGRARIKFEKDHAPSEEAGEGGYLLYKSSTLHTLENCGTSDLDLLVIRFNIWDQEPAPEQQVSGAV